ncbi:MAG: hypothetical protein GC156_03705 [Actinomycetales bacterium]|nr:hypothetical protein [Actinomycetales bacterium]
MARFPGEHSLVRASTQALGAWLHPVSPYRRHSEPERQIQRRAGAFGLVCLVTGAIAVVWAVVVVIVNGGDPSVVDPAFGPATLQGAVILVTISVFAPQAVFRTRNAALTREVLSNPSAPIRPWQSTTITFDAVLVGALLAGLYFEAALTLAFFGMAFGLRILLQSRREIAIDPNARFHSLVMAWTTGATGAAAFVIVKPLSKSVEIGGSILPLLFAALVAMYVGLVFNALERWVAGDRSRWAFARDAVDSRRIIVALVSAVIAWLVSVVGVRVGDAYGDQALLAGSLAGLAIFLAAWLILWYASIRMWHRDAIRTLALWSRHQAEVVGRLADGSLSAELAARAALPVTARMAVSVFGATRAMAILDDGRGHVTSHLAAVDRFANAPTPDPASLATLPHLRLPLFPVPGHANTSSITVAGWLWPGWFLTRSNTLIQRFTDLATETLLTPVVSADDDRIARAFDTMFDDVNRWPTLTAFEEVVARMRSRADANPHSDSLLVAVYAIDEFGALAGGRFERAAVAQVMRLAVGNPDFAGHDVFVAYEDPGRLWVALAGGPIIRNGIALLRTLQQYINDHGAVPSARLDVDVHVSVSFGYAAHQVDDFTFDGLMAMARQRLADDQGARDPFNVDSLMTYDIRPEDIIGAPDAPVTAVDVLNLMRADRSEIASDAFTTHFRPVMSLDSGGTVALVTSVAWHRTFGTLDLADERHLHALVNRQAELAAETVTITLERLKPVFAEADALGHHDLPVLAWMPSILLAPEAGELALPNLVPPALDRAECGRLVILVDAIPMGSGQALRLLADRGVRLAVTAGAATAADPTDLYGWQRWAIVFPQHVVQGPAGVDGLTIQQTASAIATHDTVLIAVADDVADARGLATNNVRWAIDPRHQHESVRESVGTARELS